MHMVGHDDPIAQQITTFVKVSHRTSNEVSNLRSPQVTRARSLIQIAFRLPAKIPRNIFLGIVDLFTPPQEIVQPEQTFSLFAFKSRQYLSGQGIGQTECDKVGGTFVLNVWQITARVNAGTKGIRHRIFDSPDAKLAACAFQAGVWGRIWTLLP
jgi:hypothetical protein